MTLAVLKTRPRISRGVFRWLMSRTATKDGALSNPVIPMSRSASQMLELSA